MKNGLLTWNVILTLITGYLLFAHFSGGKKTSSGKQTNTDSAVASNEFRMAYFEMDSVAANVDVVKDVKNELNRKETAITSELDRLTKNIQQKFNYYQNLAQAGNLSDAQSQEASQELKNLDDQLKNRKLQLDQEYTDLMTRRQNELKTKIETFLKEYNENKNFSYIITYEQGLFYYKDTAYNVTADVIKGLNEKYKAAGKN